jgi:hypothetical protein
MKFSELCVLTESADAILTKGGKVLDYTDDTAIAFAIKGPLVVWGPSMTHGEMEDRLYRTAEEETLPRNFRDINKVSAINFDSETYEPGFLLHGRFWTESPGYIAFWAEPKAIKEHRIAIQRFLRALKFDPTKVLWEVYDPKIKDEKMIPYYEFFSMVDEVPEAERRRREAKMMHLVPGAKKALGKIIPNKQFSVGMPNAQYMNMIRIGDAVDQLTKSIKKGKSCIVESYASLFEI